MVNYKPYGPVISYRLEHGQTFKWFSNKSSVIIDFKSSKSELIESVSIEPNDGDDAKWDILWNKILIVYVAL